MRAHLALTLVLAALPSFAVVAVAPRAAHACGGCFAPPDAITTVDSHRMVVSLSVERSTLWDQIQYSGAPEDFAWVLPVPSPEVDVEIASSAFFDELDFFTAPRVTPEPGTPPPCFGCCSAGGLADPGLDPDVIVYDEKVVGPYEMVVIGSEDAGALGVWLADNGYNLPESAGAVIAAYVERDSAFVALRLAPDQGVQSMQPVRVTFDGYLGTFPLEMVAVGARGTLDISLWVIAEQRYAAGNYENAEIDPDELVYDWTTATSNYAEVFADTLDAAGGRAWITEFAGPLDSLPVDAPDELERIRADVPMAFVTRMRTDMLVDHLTADLQLVPAEDASPLSRDLSPGTELNRPFDDEGGCRTGSSAGGHIVFLLAILVGMGWLGRRRRG